MNKKRFPLTAVIVFLLVSTELFFSCKKKKFDDALPIVTIESVTAWNTDSVLLTGNVTSTGAKALKCVGFAFGDKPSFSLLSNQVLFERKGTGQFQAVVRALRDSTYYFRSFAANGFGYSTSSSIKFKVPNPIPVYAPCTLTNNYIKDGGVGFTVSTSGSSVNPQFGNYMVTMNGVSEDIRVSFASVPSNGIYTTVSTSTTLGAGQICVSITNFNVYYAKPGGQIYVAIDSTGKTILTTCAIQYNNGSFDVTLYGKASY